MFATVLLSLLAPAPVPAVAVATQDPAIRITINNDRRFERGDHAKVKIRTDDDGFLVVLHADPDGRVRVLFPLDPEDDNYVRGGRTYELRDRGDRESFTVEANSGEGAIYAAVSRDPFRFDAFQVNHHWDYDALNAQDPGTDPEPVLGDIVQRMASGRYDYDYLTYDVYEYSDVAYATGAGYTPYSYYGDYCAPYSLYSCDPYYYRSRFSLYLNVGSPFYYDPFYYDPFYYGYYSPYYSPYYYRPYRTVAYYPYQYYGGGVGSYPYRPRYSSPSAFKQDTRLWGGVPYRDRIGTTPVQAVNTVYNPAPGRRVVTQGDVGRSPVSDATTQTAAPTRRRVEAVPARPEAAPRRVEQPRTVNRAVEREAAPARRGESQGSREAAPARRRTEYRSEGTPVLERRRDRDARPMIEEVSPERSRATVARPQVIERAEPRRVEAPRPEPRRAEPPRAEPSFRSAPPERSYSPPPSYSAPRSAPSQSRGGEGGGGGGGRRGPR
jgi:hypothetical protein